MIIYVFRSQFMDIFSIILLAIGLAMDCFAVSITKGICVKKFKFFYTLRMAILFGVFQALMPLIGFFIGSAFAEQIKYVDHWIALILLAFIGGRMIYQAVKGNDDEPENCSDTIPVHFQWKVLLPLAIATSIDALATGVVLVPFPEVIFKAVLIIGGVSFLLSFVGMFIGVCCGKRFNFKVEILGGIILIAIGLKIWIEHMFF